MTTGYMLRDGEWRITEKPKVKRACKVCPPLPRGREGAVSPRGIEHMPMLTEPGNMVCCSYGKAEGWWWGV